MSSRRTVSSFVVLFLSMSSLAAFAQEVIKRTSAQSHDARLSAAVTAPKAVATQVEPPLQLRLTRKYTFSPGYVQSLIKISPHTENRLLRVTLDSPNYYRSSDIELEGAGAARSHFFNWTALPAGHYDIVVTIFGPDGPRGQSREVVDVLGLR